MARGNIFKKTVLCEGQAIFEDFLTAEGVVLGITGEKRGRMPAFINRPAGQWEGDPLEEDL